MNIVIVAGGLGTRFDDLSVFPKILLPTEKYDSILHEDIDFFKGNDIYLIINSKFYNMVNNYVKVNNLNIKIISTENSNGSYNTIMSVIDKIPHNDVLFVWSDLILTEKIPIFSKNTIVTYNGGYRYRYINNEIIKVANYDGNIPGIYYINDLSIMNIACNKITNFDLVELIANNISDFDNYEITNLKEYKDKKTYINIMKSCISDDKLKTRFFNSLTVKDNNTLSKKAIDPKYYKIINDEYNWYKELNNDIICPKVYDFTDNGFEMEYLKDYIPLHKYLKTHDDSDIIDVYKNIKSNLDILHKTSKKVYNETFINDLKRELIDKVITRCDNIQYMLIKYNKDYMIKLLTKVYNHFICDCNVDYYFCHGDLNGSNIMVNQKTKQVKFIDPRGYFGNTKLYGFKPYEYSKLLYCLYGYDDFNNLPQIYGQDEPIKLNCYNKIDYLNKEEYLMLVGVIYIALAGYISQDIMKANIAYEYGIKILENIFNE